MQHCQPFTPLGFLARRCRQQLLQDLVAVLITREHGQGRRVRKYTR
jgi:hypothetical protein